MTWSKEWPTEPGYYWFYGRRSRYAEYNRLCFAQVRGAQDLIYVVDNTFMFKGEKGVIGVWHPMVVPELPTDAMFLTMT